MLPWVGVPLKEYHRMIPFARTFLSWAWGVPASRQHPALQSIENHPTRISMKPKHHENPPFIGFLPFLNHTIEELA
jgi:hypothetical protein